MSALIGHIDSLALEITNKALDKLSQIAIIKVAKNGIILDDDLMGYFKMSKLKLYDYLAVMQTETGLYYKLTKHIRAKNVTLTFQGLYQYTDISKLMRQDLAKIASLIKDDCIYARLDMAFDNNKPFDVQNIAKTMGRYIKKVKNTIYLKAAKEKKTNQHLNIKHYKKFETVYRLEFVFLKRYLSGDNENIQKRLSKVFKKTLKQQFKAEGFLALIS